MVRGGDLVNDVHLWDSATGRYVFDGTTAFNRLCSADLPDERAFDNPRTGKDFGGRLFMNGEEAGAEGRAFAHVVSGEERLARYIGAGRRGLAWHHRHASRPGPSHLAAADLAHAAQAGGGSMMPVRRPAAYAALIILLLLGLGVERSGAWLARLPDGMPAIGLTPPTLWVGLAGLACALAALKAAGQHAWIGVLPLVAIVLPPAAPWLQAAWVYAGPGLVLPWVLTLVAVAGAARLPWPRQTPAGAAGLAVLLGAVWLGGIAASVRAVALTGDAPHYLTIAQSVLVDGDFDLTNNYDARTYEPFYPGSLEPRHTNPGYLAQDYSFHGPGVAMLVLPGFAAFGAAGATATLVLLLSIGSGLLWLAAWRLTASADAAWFGWASLVASAPYALHAAAIYPDGPAAVATAAALWLLARLRDPRPTPLLALTAASLGLAALPWLHVRFAMPAGILGAAILAAIHISQPDRWTRAMWFVMVPIISCCAWVTVSYVMFDTWNPAAAMLQRTAPGQWDTAPAGLLGLLADREFGLFPVAPVMVAAPVALWMFLRRHPLAGVATGLLAAGTWGMSSLWVWWGGDAAPARFLTVVIPALALWLAVLWAEATAPTRRLLTIGLTLSAAMTGLLAGLEGGARAYNFPDGRRSVFEALSRSVDVAQALPSLLGAGASVATELPVAVVWAAAVTALVAIVGRLPPMHSHAAASGVAGLLTLLVVAAATAAGWSVRGVAGWTPGLSSLVIAQALARPGFIVAAGYPARPVSAAALAGRLRLSTPEDVPLEDETRLAVTHLPAGRYAVESARRGGDGDNPVMTLALGRDAWPFATWRLTEPAPTFAIVAPVHSARVDGARRDEVEVWLRPLGPIAQEAPAGEARRITPMGDVVVYSMDDNHFVEGSGLWTGADRSTRLLVTTSRGASVTLRLEAGPSGVSVGVAAPSARQTIDLAPHQQQDVPLGAVTPGAWIDLRFVVRGGFAASALGDGRDTRRLGAWASFSVPPP